MNKFMHTCCFLQRVSSIHPIPLRWIEEPRDPGLSSYIAALPPQTQISSGWKNQWTQVLPNFLQSKLLEVHGKCKKSTWNEPFT